MDNTFGGLPAFSYFCRKIKIMRLVRLFSLLLLLLCAFSVVLPARDRDGGGCPVVRIVPERLPDMTMPRSGHNIFYAGGELTVVGGHTTNFVTTQTAEYFADGSWHLLPTAYSHDNGFAVVMQSGEVIIGGGHSESLGIGQTFHLERYHPSPLTSNPSSLTSHPSPLTSESYPAHSFEGFGCLDHRRVLGNATQLGDGRVIITGNHYAEDAIGCYDGRSQVQHIKEVKQGRTNPYILPIARDEAVIIGSRDLRDRLHDTVWADRVKGEPFRVPLLEEWKLVPTDQPFSSTACARGDNGYLLTAQDKTGQLTIVMMRDTVFSLLPTSCPIPMKSPFGPVFYKGPIVVDSLHKRGYVMGVDSLYLRQYVLAVDYARQPAELTLYHTDTLEHATITIPIVTPEGDLILAGGIPCDNYKPLSAVWLYRFTTMAAEAEKGTAVAAWIWWILAAIAIIAVIGCVAVMMLRKKRAEVVPAQGEADETEDFQTLDLTKERSAELMESICRLMDEEQVYLRSDLKMQDVAVMLSSNSSYISECINNNRGQSFSQFINTYRISYAQELLRRQPDMKMAIVAMKSGFSAEVSFFRNFKAATGMTPREWLASQ